MKTLVVEFKKTFNKKVVKLWVFNGAMLNLVKAGGE